MIIHVYFNMLQEDTQLCPFFAVLIIVPDFRFRRSARVALPVPTAILPNIGDPCRQQSVLCANDFYFFCTLMKYMSMCCVQCLAWQCLICYLQYMYNCVYTNGQLIASLFCIYMYSPQTKHLSQVMLGTQREVDPPLPPHCHQIARMFLVS